MAFSTDMKQNAFFVFSLVLSLYQTHRMEFLSHAASH